jgi:hypothetical protein
MDLVVVVKCKKKMKKNNKYNKKKINIIKKK